MASVQILVPAQRYVFVRNPYYHRIDSKGQQLPYIDRVIFTQAATNLVPAKAGLGEADLQPRYLNMRDYTFLKKSAKSSGAEVLLWEVGSGSQVALYPNLNANDGQWRRLFRDVRATEIYQGTSEAQRMIIAASVLANV